MRFSAQISYDASPAEVFAMLTDTAFQDRKLAETGSLEFSSAIVVSGDTAEITTHRTLPTDRVPDAFRSLVGGRLTVIQVETWKAAGGANRTGTVTLHVQGAPLRMTGTLLLTGTQDRTTEDVDGELKASIPLIGGRIERSIEPAVRAAIDVEQRIGREWLSAT